MWCLVIFPHQVDCLSYIIAALLALSKSLALIKHYVEHDVNQALCVNSAVAAYEWVLASRPAFICVRIHDVCK
jgi:hypothetical protein